MKPYDRFILILLYYGDFISVLIIKIWGDKWNEAELMNYV
jgi:hypothetical protein